VASFIYKARDASGAVTAGAVEADGLREAAESLRARGLLITSLRPGGGLSGLSLRFPTSGRRPRRRLRLRDLALFCRQFSTMLRAGVSILASLRILARQASNRALKTALQETAADLEGGMTLSEALARPGRGFPSMMVNMVHSGEAGGLLDEAFERLAGHFEREDAVNAKTRSALIYPAILLTVCIGVTVFMVTVVLPTYISLFSDMGTHLPLPTRVLLGISMFVRRRWYLLLLAVAGLWVAAGWWARQESGRRALHAWLLRVPVIGDLAGKVALARFARTLGALSQSGVPILTALDVTRRAVGNVVLAELVDKSRRSVQEGQPLTLPLRASGLVPPMVVEMLAVGEETGAMEAMLFRVADFFEREVDRGIERATALIEPAMIIVMGVVVGFVLLAIVLPMFDVFSFIQ